MEKSEGLPAILMVDDRQENLVALRAVLETLEAELVGVTSGRDALLQILHRNFALILLDVKMPEMDGVETAALIRQRAQTATTPIIFLTAYDHPSDLVFRGYEIGAFDFIRKPLDAPLLRSKVKTFLDLHNYIRRVERQAEELRVSEERYALAAAGAADGLFDWSIEDQQVHFSPRWCEIIGCEKEDLTGSVGDWVGRIEPEERQRVEAALNAHLRGETEYLQVEHALKGADGEQRWVQVRALAVRDEKGAAVRMAGSMSDITGRKRAESELLRKERLATIGMTITNIAHSIKNIFTAMSGAISILKKEINPDSQVQQETVQIIESAYRRLNMMITNMLDYSKERSIEREEVRCEKLFEELKALLAAAAKSKEITLDFQIGEGAEVFNHDNDRLLRCLMNLGVNAVDAVHAGSNGQVVFSATVCPADGIEPPLEEGTASPGAGVRCLVLEVADNGEGMKPEVQSRIFEPFFSTKASRGTGLGLSSVQQFVKESGGVLRLESEYGLGTKFRLIFFDALKGEEAMAPERVGV